MEFTYQKDNPQDRYQQFHQFIHRLRISERQPLRLSSLKNNDEILSDIAIYPSEKKEVLKSAILDFRNRTGDFQKVLFNLLFQLREMETYVQGPSWDSLDMLYSAKLRGITKTITGAPLQLEEPEVYEAYILEIEQLLAQEKNEIFSAPEMADFNPPVFKGQFTLNDLNAIQKHVVFMLLSCVKDETFTGFCKNIYGMSIGPFRKELRDLGDKVSLAIESIIPQAQDACVYGL